MKTHKVKSVGELCKLFAVLLQNGSPASATCSGRMCYFYHKIQDTCTPITLFVLFEKNVLSHEINHVSCISLKIPLGSKEGSSKEELETYLQTASFPLAFPPGCSLQPTYQLLWCSCSGREAGVETGTILLLSLRKDNPGRLKTSTYKSP